MKNSVCIVGGGVVGLLCAYYLNKKGFGVTVFDKGNFEDGASYGNAGMIVPSHFIPLANPGALAKGVQWMFNPESPFYIKLRLDKSLYAWLYHFLKKANNKHVNQSAELLYKLNLESKIQYDQLKDELGDFGLRQSGLIMYCKTQQALDDEVQIAEKAKQLGQDVKVLDQYELQKLEPNIITNVAGAVHFKDDAFLNPNELMKVLKIHLRNNGVKLIGGSSIEKLISNGSTINGLVVNGEVITADHFVIAAGTWSAELAKSLGIKLHMQGAKGYSFDLERKHLTASICSILTESKVACTPMGDIIRFAGTLAIDGMNDSIDRKRLRGIYDSIPQYFPQLEGHPFQNYQVWHGYRPCSADGLPYIGRTAKFNNLLIATGHGMMGLSLGAITGKLISQAICNEQSDLYDSQISADRHNSRPVPHIF